MRCGNCKEDHATVAEVQECYGRPTLARTDVLPARTSPPAIIAELLELPMKPPEEAKNFILGTAPEKGRFTVVFSESEQVTIRFHQPTMGRYAGKRIVQYLYGPDNMSDYRTVGTVSENGVTVFPEFLKRWALPARTKVIRGIIFLLGASKEDVIKAGETYSLKSNNCWRCGRDLTREESITRGMGPICAKKEALL